MQRIFGSSSTGKMIFRALLTICLLTGWSALQVPLEAQTDTGRVTGSTTDPTGAAIPGVTITITNLQNNAVRVVTSGGDGNFAVNALLPGKYRVEVKANGFSSVVQSFSLDVSQ